MSKVVFTDDLNINPRNYASLYEVYPSHLVFCPKADSVLKMQNLLVDHFKHARFDSESSIDRLKNGAIRIGSIEISIQEVAKRIIRQHLVVYDDELSAEVNFVSYAEQVDALRRHPIALKNIIKMLDYWESFFNNNISRLNRAKVVVVFGGTNLLPSIMLALCKRLGIRTVVSEHFVTGIDQFLEFRYSPIPNCSNAGKFFDPEHVSTNEDINKVINKFNMNANKNVTRVADITEDVEIRDPYVLFIAQVPNDASMSFTHEFYSPIAKTLETIEWFLNNTDLKVVVKWHPWESKKVFTEECLSRNKIQAALQNHPDAEKRVLHIDHGNLLFLAQQSEACLTICSQAAIEIGLYTGRRTITLMKTYYDFMGVSVYCPNIQDLSIENLDMTFDIPGYNKFKSALTWFVLDYLVCKFPSGKRRIKEIVPLLLLDNALPLSPGFRTSEKQTVLYEYVGTGGGLIQKEEVSLPVEIVPQEAFELKLRTAPELIDIPPNYKVARYLQTKKWARPIWRFVGVPLTRARRAMRDG